MSIGSWLDGVFDSGDAESREKMLSELKAIVEKRERLMAEEFYNYGPDYLKAKIESLGGDFRKIYDSLIYRQNILKNIVLAHMDTFVDMVSKKGPNYMRQVFSIEDARYDDVFEDLFDIVAVSGGGLFEYLKRRESHLTASLKEGGAVMLRQDLGMVSSKYDELWLEIIGQLLQSFCVSYDDERVIDTGIRSFVGMFNSGRQHRSLRSFSKMWEYSTVSD